MSTKYRIPLPWTPGWRKRSLSLLHQQRERSSWGHSAHLHRQRFTTSEIIIHTSHWRIDYIGGLSLLNNLLTACIEPRHIQFGDERKNLSPSRDEVAKFSSLDTMESPAMVEERGKAVTDLLIPLGNLPSIGLPTQKGKARLGTT